MREDALRGGASLGCWACFLRCDDEFPHPAADRKRIRLNGRIFLPTFRLSDGAVQAEEPTRLHLNRAEIVHAVILHVFWKKATQGEAESALKVLDRDCIAGVWRQVDFPVGTFARRIDLARRYGPTLGFRTLDSLHIACALELKAQRFWTFDDRQARLAEAVGLNTTP